MCVQYHPFLFAVLSIATAAFATVDDAAVRALKNKMSGAVENATLSPVWNPDDSALFHQSGGTVWEVSTATGQKKEAIAPESLARFFDGKPPVIPHFTITETGGFVCLAVAGKQIRTISASGQDLSVVEPADNPFALQPKPVGPNTRSGKGNGGTKLHFINDTEETHAIEWIAPSGTRRKYATLKPGETHVQNTYAGHVFTAGGLAYTAAKQPAIAFLSAKPVKRDNGKRPAKTPNTPPAKWSAEIRDHNLFVKNNETGKELQLTTDGSKDWNYVGPMRWSPNGRHLVVSKEKAGTRRTIDLVCAAPSDQLQPKTQTISYAKPGDILDIRKPHLFDLEAGREIPLDDSLHAHPFHIKEFHWTPEGDRLFFLYNERGHQTLRLLALQAATGKIATVIEEKSPTFIDYSQKTLIHHLDETDETIWMSERSGWNHLYLVNRRNGSIKPITSGHWVVRGIEQVDEEKRQVWFELAGHLPGQDPYYSHFARINFDGTGLVLLTEGNGTHSVHFSKDRRFYTDSWSRADQPPVHELRRSSDGQKIADLGKADASRLLGIHPHLPEPFVAKGRDGKTDIHGVIYRPSHFDPKKNYPVIESIYAGPHGFFTQKAFKPYSKQQGLAELGFIVVQIDGMGTNWRSKEFHDVCWKNIKDAGFPDRIAWIKAAAQKHPCMDIARVGIHGGSAGGQNAMRAVLDHADFYQVAIADCGCHDNRMDKLWWNEAWMGWPVDESYGKSSNLVDAHKLNGKLLLAVGMLDSNVDPSSTMQVVDALIQAGKDFELYAAPNGGHCVLDTPYGQHRRRAFFVRHLLNKESL
ncbi:Dipeptidyl aminopeptidase 4 [Pontiella desulfatans]|uniref:Dipeptidyl aminopeptidase 4 n=1 Tax=Pontiella desulfatans TaxID=2750659 RepID=A0A6C2U5L2_PONDE|nr:DPP IV N-terminal domain-containing protein [Pontiella desulfatans]VGO15290.1 Dipeptidyl aminopeptidase 4 [Pontiella desulfatans]